MDRTSIFAIGLLVFSGLAVGCSDTVNNQTPEGVTTCQSDDDCPGANESCEPNQNGTKVCSEQFNGCVDKDGDGFGSNDNRAECPACKNPEANDCNPAWQDCCAKDCDDTNAMINPAQVEACDGIDNNCDGTVDAPIGKGACQRDNGSCPITGQEPQQNTAWSCTDKIDGTPQCILKGAFTAKDGCSDPSSFGKCVNGEWTQVPDKCTTN